MKCFVTPYEGDQDYLFFSYCHENAAEVYPIIERLVLEGFRVWFDDGIHPGEDWPEVIATHLSRAKLCVAAITKASAESHNCRNEVSFAISGNLPFLSLILEDFPMPAGIRLQLSSANYLRKFELSEDDFYNKLLSSPVLAGCRDASVHADAETLRQWREHAAQYQKKNKGDAVSGGSALPGFSSWFSSRRERQAKTQAAEKPKAQPEKKSPASPKPRPSTSQPEVIEATTAPGKPSGKSETATAEPLQKTTAAPAAAPKPRPNSSGSRGGRHLKPEAPPDDECQTQEELPITHRDRPETDPMTVAVPRSSGSADPEDDDGKTVMFPRSRGTDDDGEERTVMGSGFIQAILFRVSTGEVFSIRNSVTVLGRSEKTSDIVLKGNSAISRKHAEIIFRRGQWAIHDLGASFGTKVNGKALDEGQIVSLTECSDLTLADEQFFFVYGSSYDRIFDERKLCLLRCAETGETRLLVDSNFPLNRYNKWKDGILGDPRISRSEHAEILRKSGKLYLLDMNSRNGTFLNGQRLAPQTPVQLHDRDRIAIVETGFVYYEVVLGT